MLKSVCVMASLAFVAPAAAESPQKRIIVVQESVICKTGAAALDLAKKLSAGIEQQKPEKIGQAFIASMKKGCRPLSLDDDRKNALWMEKPTYESKSFLLGYDTYVRVSPVSVPSGTTKVEGFLVLIGQDVTDQANGDKA